MFTVEERDVGFRRRLTELFKVSGPDWMEGWRFVHDIGLTGVPAIRRELVRESNRKRRLLLIAALGIAAGDGAVALPSRPWKERGERFLGLAGVAMGRRTESGLSHIRRDLEDEKELLRIVACLALERLPEAARRKHLPDALLSSTDVGVLAAGCFADPRLTAEQVEQRLKDVSQQQHRALVWRGWFLGRPGKVKSSVLAGRRNAALKALADRQCAWRREAAAWLGHTGPDGSENLDLTKLEPEERLLLAHAPGWRPLLFADGVLPRVPAPSQDVVVRQRMLVLRILTAAPRALIADSALPNLGSPPELRVVACLALCARLSRDKELRKALSGFKGFDVAETALLDVCLGRTPKTKRDPKQFQYSELERLYALSRAGRVTKPDLAGCLEQLLWQHGAHPALTRMDLHWRLFRDLTLGEGRGVYEPRGALTLDNARKILASAFVFTKGRARWGLAEHPLRY